MKTNLTLSIEEEVLQAARKRALEQGTSVNQMVREFLEEISGLRQERARALDALRRLREELDITVGRIDWTRDELHER